MGKPLGETLPEGTLGESGLEGVRQEAEGRSREQGGGGRGREGRGRRGEEQGDRRHREASSWEPWKIWRTAAAQSVPLRPGTEDVLAPPPAPAPAPALPWLCPGDGQDPQRAPCEPQQERSSAPTVSARRLRLRPLP